jgi:hypothetical protein
MMVVIGLTGVTLASVVSFFANQARYLRSHAFRLEAQQAMRASLDAITRDVRLAGACLPGNGAFMALTGTNGPGADSLTIRTGALRPDLSCVQTSLSQAVVAGTRTLQLASTNGFTPEMIVYVRDPQGFGELGDVTDVAPGTLTLASGLQNPYAQGSGVDGVDERVYAIDASNPEVPLLTLAVNREPPRAFAAGMRDLQVEYVLDRDCSPCDVVDFPPDAATWRLVNEVVVTATVDTVGAVRPEDRATLVSSSTAKPRNLLQQQGGTR